MRPIRGKIVQVRRDRSRIEKDGFVFSQLGAALSRFKLVLGLLVIWLYFIYILF